MDDTYRQVKFLLSTPVVPRRHHTNALLNFSYIKCLPDMQQYIWAWCTLHSFWVREVGSTDTAFMMLFTSITERLSFVLLSSTKANVSGIATSLEAFFTPDAVGHPLGARKTVGTAGQWPNHTLSDLYSWMYESLNQDEAQTANQVSSSGAASFQTIRNVRPGK